MRRTDMIKIKKKTINTDYFFEGVRECLCEGIDGRSFLVGTDLKCSLWSGSHDTQSGSLLASLNLSRGTARSKTATSDDPNIDPKNH